MAKKNEPAQVNAGENSSAQTKKSWKSRLNIPIDKNDLKGMELKDQIFYLALHGWRMEIEERSGNQYLYAIRYIDRKKQRIYMAKAINFLDLVSPKKS